MRTEEVLAAIDREWTRLIAAVDALGAGATTVTVADEGWTAKDVLGHCIHWAKQIAFGLGAQVQPPAYMLEERKRREAAGEDTTKMPTADESNALALAYYANVALEDVRAELESLVEAIVERVRLRTDEQMIATDAIPFAGQRPLWQQIGSETFLHWPVHAGGYRARCGAGGLVGGRASTQKPRRTSVVTR